MRFIALLLVAMFTVSILTACGGGSEAPSQTIKEGDAKAKAAQDAAGTENMLPPDQR